MTEGDGGHTFEDERQAEQCRPVVAVFRDVFGNPFRPVEFPKAWRTTAAVRLATAAYDRKAFDALPVLADALEEAGCDVAEILDHCRDPHAAHVRGCWVVDLVSGKR